MEMLLTFAAWSRLPGLAALRSRDAAPAEAAV